MLAPDEKLDFPQLIETARQGCREAMEKLFERSTPRIELWNRSWYDFLVRHRLSARDLTQDVLLIAGYSFGQFRGTTDHAWFGWLFSIHRRVVDELRNRKDALSFAIPVDSGKSSYSGKIEIPSRELTPGSAMALIEEKDRIADVLKRVDPVHRESLQFWMQGVTLQEQAKAMNLSMSQVRTLRLNSLLEFSKQWKSLRGPL